MAWRFTKVFAIILRITYSLVDFHTGPHHVQEACPTVNCVWGKPNATYVHLAARQCVVECAKEPARCPFATSKGSSVSLLEAPPGGFAKKANVARRPRRGDGVI